MRPPGHPGLPPARFLRGLGIARERAPETGAREATQERQAEEDGLFQGGSVFARCLFPLPFPLPAQELTARQAIAMKAIKDDLPAARLREFERELALKQVSFCSR
mgnify:CR=1 FL=1